MSEKKKREVKFSDESDDDFWNIDSIENMIPEFARQKTIYDPNRVRIDTDLVEHIIPQDDEVKAAEGEIIPPKVEKIGKKERIEDLLRSINVCRAIDILDADKNIQSSEIYDNSREQKIVEPPQTNDVIIDPETGELLSGDLELAKLESKQYEKHTELIPPKESSSENLNIKRFDQLDDVLPSYYRKSSKERRELAERRARTAAQRAVGSGTASSELIYEYRPENPLIETVKISMWPSKYSFYEHFRSDAVKYFSAVGKECEYTQFFAYIPQYRLLMPEQKRYYFWWREQLRTGKYIKTDFSYIFLYIYEIINLPELIPPEKGADMLIGVWLAYRDQYPKLDRYMSEWYCDYCLINRLTPDTRLASILPVLLENSTFREFYVLPLENGYSRSAIVRLFSNYNYRDSRYYLAKEPKLIPCGLSEDPQAAVEILREAYNKHIPTAFDFAIRSLTDTGVKPFADGFENPEATSKIVRDAYSGALCAYNVKRRIEIIYRTLTKSSELRLVITDMVKYSENKVRELLGVKARLSVQHLTSEIKAAINEYFAPYIHEKRERKLEKAEVSVPDYERYYEAEHEILSPERAAQIERDSWAVTEMLVEDVFSDTDTESDISPQLLEKEEDKVLNDESISSDIPVEISAPLKVLLGSNGNREFNIFAKNKKLMPEALCEKINEYMYDIIGDAVIEEKDDGFGLIDDYIENLKEILKL